MVDKGLVMGLVMGIAAVVITALIAFVIVQNVALVDDDIATSILANRIINESISAINGTTYTVASAGITGFSNFEVIAVRNATNTITSGNYTAVATAGTIVGTAGRTHNYTNAVVIDYDYKYTPTEGSGDRMITNFTEGVDNVASQIPNILLIAAVVLILGILALLWQQYQKMDIGGGGNL